MCTTQKCCSWDRIPLNSDRRKPQLSGRGAFGEGIQTTRRRYLCLGTVVHAPVPSSRLGMLDQAWAPEHRTRLNHWVQQRKTSFHMDSLPTQNGDRRRRNGSRYNSWQCCHRTIQRDQGNDHHRHTKSAKAQARRSGLAYQAHARNISFAMQLSRPYVFGQSACAWRMRESSERSRSKSHHGTQLTCHPRKAQSTLWATTTESHWRSGTVHKNQRSGVFPRRDT